MKTSLLILIFFFSVSLAKAQGIIMISAGGTVDTCAGFFYDSGGFTGNYGNNENFTMTFHSPDPLNADIKMLFNTFDVYADDTLYVYDGSTTAAPLIGAYNNSSPPPVFVIGSVFNLSGDLTFRFRSNGANTAAGWSATLKCAPACQTVNAALDSTLTVPMPVGNNYIDVCSGTPVTFAGTAAYPQNNIHYNQSNATSTFLWDFGDGSTAIGQTVQHTYTVASGYDVKLTVVDNHGCENINDPLIRVRMSKSPVVAVHNIPAICSGKILKVMAGDSVSDDIQYAPNVFNSLTGITKQINSDTTFLPDGPNCPPNCYNNYVTFNSFGNCFGLGATIGSASDILSICVNIEHSFCGDLGFTITCPNGTSVNLDPNTHSGSMYMGEPYGGNNHANFDSNTNPCDPAYNPHGTGWIYCWSQVYPQAGTLDASSYTGGFGSTGMSMEPTDTVNHTHYFTPNNPLDGLIGCPVDGTWNLQICDDWAIDNGYIFMWEINVNPTLLPAYCHWSYTVPVDSMIWNGPYIDTVNTSYIIISPDQAGIYDYTVTFKDDFGCSFDKTISVPVVQTPHVDLGHDTTVCGNSNVFYLNAGQGNHYQWSNLLNSQIIPVTVTGNYAVTVENYDTTGMITCAGADSIFVNVLPAVSVYIGPDIYYFTGHPVTLDAGNPGDHYQWSTGVTTQTITVNQAGIYCVTVTDPSGILCEGIDCMQIFTGSGVADNAKPAFAIYPNPASDKITIESAAFGRNEWIFIYDIQRQLLMQQLIQKAKTEIDVSRLSKGVYIIKFGNPDNIAINKFIKD